MPEKNILSKKSLVDFSYMFSSNLIKKGLGFFREIILAFFFGSSGVYANYLFLKTIADFFSQFTLGNSLQANLMPKFTKLYVNSDSVDLSGVIIFAKSFSWKLFLFSQIIQIPIIWFINPESKILFIGLSILLGVVMSANFFNSVFLTILQAKGEFKKHSVATTLNLFVSTVVLFPLLLLLDIVGVVLSRLFGVFTLTLKYIKPLLSEKGTQQATLSYSDFNLSVLLLGNFANIIILLGRLVSGADGGNEIAFFTYSVVLLNTLLTAVVMNVNTLVLKFISIKKDYKVILFSTIVAALTSGILVLIVHEFSDEIISFIFERGKFTSKDTSATATYLRDISWSFIFIFISSSLFQPYFTLPQSYLKSNSKYLARPFVLAVICFSIFLYFNSSGVRLNSLYMIYGLSAVSFVLSILAFLKYKKYVI